MQLQTGADEPLTLTLAQLGMSVDTTATAQAALARGRYRLPLGLQVWLPGGGGDVAPAVRVNAAAYQQGLEAVRAAVDAAPRDAGLDISASGDGVTVVPSKDGTTADAVALARAIDGRRRPWQGLPGAGADEGRAAAGEHGRRRGACRSGGACILRVRSRCATAGEAWC